MILAQAAFAHVHVQAGPSQNRIRIQWKFPCVDPPIVDQRDTTTYGQPPGTPPPDVSYYVAEVDDPDQPHSSVLAQGAIQNGEEYMSVQTTGCAQAGGDAIDATSVPKASVGSETAPMRLHIDRLVVVGAPDVVRLTLTGGSLQTMTTSAGDVANATLKLIVYPDQATADADPNLQGTGSVFFGAVTLVGSTGTLVPLQGFSAADFLVQSVGGTYTATPLAGFLKVIPVSNANTAVVSMEGDPKTSPESAVGVSEPTASGLWLAPASPNPTHGDTHIRFAIPKTGPVTLGIFDQQGRRVRQLVDGTLSAGAHEVRWDGRDAAGRQVPSALYFYRLVADGRPLTGRVFSLR
jgi:hypothetical protein